MVSRSYRDTFIIVGVLVIVAVGYLFFSKSQSPPAPAGSGEYAHPEVEGMDRSAMASAINLPADYNSLIQVGNQTMDQGNFPVAAEAYKRALAIKGDDPDVRTDYGACLHGMGLPHRALEEFSRVLKDHPQHKIATFNVGIVYYNEKQFDSARVYWERYLVLEPEGDISSTVRQYLQQLDG
jgi:tetratricopeptide (TPR) repeat protein